MRKLGLLLVVPVSYAIGDAVLAPTPVPAHPSFIDTVLASRAVVAAIRLAIIFAAAFVVASVVALTGRRQWLTRVGPVQVSERVSDLVDENERLKKSIDTMRVTVDNLEQDVARSSRLLDHLTKDPGGSG
ncbi:MAG TPA: hypothetical protein VFI17_14280 [Solirubrobacterales bacterium]|nr:hypothetical protein [Solirubrobacterales bacterium]